MKLLDLFEQRLKEAESKMKVVGFLPGRFQPFHKGHKAVYDEIAQMTGENNAYVLTSDDTSSFKSPFSYEDKRLIMTRMASIPGDKIIKVKSPYSIPSDLTFDDYNTVALFAVSSKDMQGDARFQFPSDGLAMRQDGQPKYLQKYPGSVEQCEPMATHAYVMEVDVHSFTIAGHNASSATEIRALLIGEADIAEEAFTDLYGTFDREVFDMMRERLEKKVMTIEAVHQGERYNPQHLEAFRVQSIRELMAAKKWIDVLARDTIDAQVIGFEPIGSVLDKSRFSPSSDVDGAIVVCDPSRPVGVLHDETETMQRIMMDHQFSFGVLNIGVLNTHRVAESLITEGGNVWKDLLKTQRIRKDDILPTVQWLEQLTGLPLQKNLLGSTGLKDDSGDIDVGVEGSMSKEQLADKLTQWAAANDDGAMVKKTGSSVHFRTPIKGDKANGYVQTDFMFVPDLEFSKWAMAAPESKFGGAARSILLSSIAKTIGLRYSTITGLSSRTSDRGIEGGKDPDVIARTLLGPNATKDDLRTFETVFATLKTDPAREEKIADARVALGKQGITI